MVLLPAIAVRFVVSAVSSTLTGAGHVQLAGAWQVFSFLFSLPIYLVGSTQLNVTQFFTLIAAVEVTLYFFMPPQFFMAL